MSKAYYILSDFNHSKSDTNFMDLIVETFSVFLHCPS